MKNILVCLFLAIIPFGYGQNKKVLFIGNSYTGVNNLPNLVEKVAAANGTTLIYDANTPGGTSLEQHTQNPLTLSKIKAEDWDFVVIQGQSQMPSFPDTQVETSVYPYAKILVDSIRANNTCSVPLFYNTWGRRDGDPQWEGINTFEKMNARLSNAYNHMTEVNEGMLSPIGIGFAHIKNDENSPIAFNDLFQGDGSHPTIHASYMAACIFSDIIFSNTAIGNTFIPNGISEEEANYLQTVADHVVYGVDSIQIDYRPLAQNTFSYEIEDFQITVNPNIEQGSLLSWNYGDNSTVDVEDITHVYDAEGIYWVTMVSGNECYQDTVGVEITISTLGSWDNSIEKKFQVYPNPSVNGVVQIKHLDEPFTVYSAIGKKIFEGKTTTLQLEPGLYFFTGSKASKKVIVL